MPETQETKQNIRVLRRDTELLPCTLTDGELLRFGADLATINQDIAREDAHQTSLKQQLKAKLTQLDARRIELSCIIKNREECRPVEVEERLDFIADECQQVRVDTCEVVHTRPITEHERQEDLALGGDQPDPPERDSAFQEACNVAVRLGTLSIPVLQAELGGISEDRAERIMKQLEYEDVIATSPRTSEQSEGDERDVLMDQSQVDALFTEELQPAGTDG